jgi:ABC-type cobalt transport system substrate-binding protein
MLSAYLAAVLIVLLVILPGSVLGTYYWGRSDEKSKEKMKTIHDKINESPKEDAMKSISNLRGYGHLVG